MKISLNWLTDYVDVSSMGVSQLVDVLMRIGFPCDETIETDSDIVLDVEVTSNRPDLLGYVGMARELATALGLEFKPPVIGEPSASGKIEDFTSVEVLAPELCPRYTARLIRGVKIGPSPSWLIERLESAGLRGVNNVVDVTNFVLLEYSQPLHSFDYDKLTENRIVVRRAADGEVMVSIDETKCKLDSSMLVIADAARPIAVAGIMGGLGTEVDTSTANVLVESAQFDPLTTRRTSRKLQLMSESNFRFERGVDPVGVAEASLRACELIIDLAGGELVEGMVDVWAEPFQPPVVALRPERTNMLLGMDVPAERQAEILAGLGLTPKTDGDNDGKRIVCTIPPYRRDLKREVDLIEEVARMEGFETIPLGERITHSVVAVSPSQRVRRGLEHVLSAAGFDEAVTVAFVDDEEVELFGSDRIVRITTSRRTNNALRQTVLPSLLKVLKTNQDAGNTDVSIYELANVFPPGDEEHLPAEHPELAMATMGDLRRLSGALEAVVARVAPDAKLEIHPKSAPGLDGASAGEILLDGEVAGVLGVISAKVQDHYGLEHTPAVAAIRYDSLVNKSSMTRTYKPVAKFPPVQRDLSLIVDEDVTWRQLSDEILATDQPMREAMRYVTTYRGKPIPAGRKSVTVTLTYRSSEATLRSEQVDGQVDDILSRLRGKFRAELRT